MAKLIAFADAAHPDRQLWIHPDAIEEVRSVGNGY